MFVSRNGARFDLLVNGASVFDYVKAASGVDLLPLLDVAADGCVRASRSSVDSVAASIPGAVVVDRSRFSVATKIAARMCEEFFNRDYEYYCTLDLRDGELSEGGVIGRKNWTSYSCPHYRSVRAGEVLRRAGVDDANCDPGGWLLSHDGKPSRRELKRKLLLGLSSYATDWEK